MALCSVWLQLEQCDGKFLRAGDDSCLGLAELGDTERTRRQTAIDAKVEEQTEAFGKALERDETMAAHQVCLSFFERRVRPSTFGLFRSEEKVVWERWHIPLLVHARDDLGGQAERAQRSLALEDTLRQRIECVLSMAACSQCPLGNAPARLLRLLVVRLVAPGNSALPGERPAP